MDDINKAIAHLEEEVKEIKIHIEKISKRPDVLFKGEWMDGHDVRSAFHISERTLRTLRATGILTTTRLLKKYYYSVSEIKSLLQKNYNRKRNSKKT